MKRKLLAILCSLILYFSPASSWAAEQPNYIEIAPTEIGTLYVDLNQVQTMRKDNTYYLLTAVEERYSNEEFLADLRQEEGLENAAGMLSMYMFDNRGYSYCEFKKCIYDTDGKIILDFGGEMAMQQIGDNKTILDIYTVSLKHLEEKKQTKRWLK